MRTSGQFFIQSPAKRHKTAQYELQQAWSQPIEHMIFCLYTDDVYTTTSYKMQRLIRAYMALMSRQQLNMDEYNSNTDDSVRFPNTYRSTEPEDRLEYWLSQLLIEMLQIAIHELIDEGNTSISTHPLTSNSLIIHIRTFQSALSPSTRPLLDLALKHLSRSYALKRRLHYQPLAPAVQYSRWQMLMSREALQLCPTQRVLLVQLWLDYMEQHPQLLQVWLHC
ncbi:hypothetical protein [Paenibacillus wenxiniae]|uniref:Uncharacterized protein n=1 Tax=Paenibacillus wenxiniae TaxID=1636843 RepID=A0ABW4RQP3_9BACL